MLALLLRPKLAGEPKISRMKAQPISISLQDPSGGYEISPDRVPLALLRTFAADVDEFLKGENTDIDTAGLDVSVFQGSLGLRTSPIAHPGLLRDVRILAASERLDGMDLKRRKVIERWQKAARGARKKSYRIEAPFLANAVVISAQTDFHADDADQWVKVERYLQGEIFEIGGQGKVNAHILLPDGTKLTVASERDVFRDDKVNRLYKPAMARITAEYNVVTREYRNARLLAFEEHESTLDEEQLKRSIRRGAQAWKDVSNPSEWVDELRGNSVKGVAS